MQSMLDLLEGQAIEKDTETLQKFYESVKMRASGIDNAEGKQRIIIELYDKFFKTAFPKMVEKLGIVYTPVEVVDFIVHSVNDVLKKEFDRSISDENIHVLDPFTGTGTFITRLLQSGLIDKNDLHRKYQHEIHANEIVLLAYYIAAVNIENAFHDALEQKDYMAFEGICLTDTFQLGESDESEKLFSEMFPQNSERVAKQKKAPLRIIMGNPPYSIGQKSANDNAQNQSYPKLDAKVAKSYAEDSKATSVKALYDPYIKAFRWSTDRLDINGGIICFVSNGSWLEVNGMDGFRKSLQKEFSSIYVFNLRGNALGSGEKRKKEAGNVFGAGTRTSITITLLVKKPKTFNEALIKYFDIGDYLSRDEKLSAIRKFHSVDNPQINWTTLTPNEQGDWIRQRNDIFSTFTAITSDKKFDSKSQSYFVLNSLGINSNRDSWVYNSSKKELRANMERMVSFYNKQVEGFRAKRSKDKNADVLKFIETDPKLISWSSSLIPHLEKGSQAKFETKKTQISLYRPFFKQHLYFGEKMIHRRGQMSELFPNTDLKNLVISITGIGSSKEFSTIISDIMPDIQVQMNCQCFPLYYFEEREKQNRSLFDDGGDSEFIRRDGVSDFILERAKKQYGKNVAKEDIFYYVYGFLHSIEYRELFTNDLKKMLPRLPLVEDVKDFWTFSKAGRKLADLHINYENVPALKGVKVTGVNSGFYTVEKMRFPKKDQKDTIIYNSKIVISEIPAKAYEYVVNGKSAIEWIIERYQVTTHKESGITNDPNDWAKEVGNPRYILDLLLSIINVSVQTVEIVEGLPKFKFD
jgi:predicted helicase